MRYPASEKLEIIRLVEQSHLPVRRTLEKLGIQPARFYRWYDRLQTGGLEALEDKASRPTCVWNRIPDAIRERIVQLALDEPELSPRELATRFTDTANYFVSEASSSALPSVPTMIEAGVPNYEAVLWMALVAPANTPTSIVEKLNTAMNKVLVEVKAQLQEQGVEPGGSKPEDVKTRTIQELAKWKDVVAKSGPPK